MTDEDAKRWKELAELAEELDRLATKAPWIDGPDFVSSLDPGQIAVMREHDRQFEMSLARAQERSTGEKRPQHEIDRRLDEAAKHYGGGYLVCESISPSDRIFVAESRRVVPELGRAVRALLQGRARMHDRVEAMKSDVREASAKIERLQQERDAALEMAQVERAVCAEATSCHNCVSGDGSDLIQELRSELESAKSEIRYYRGMPPGGPLT